MPIASHPPVTRGPRRSFTRLFTAHPSAVGETYLQHLLRAAAFGARMVTAGSACLVHALLPFLFQDIASLTVQALHAKLRRPGES